MAVGDAPIIEPRAGSDHDESTDLANLIKPRPDSRLFELRQVGDLRSRRGHYAMNRTEEHHRRVDPLLVG